MHNEDKPYVTTDFMLRLGVNNWPKPLTIGTKLPAKFNVNDETANPAAVTKLN